MEMSSTRPYLVRAMYEWIVDNHRTPYLLVEAGVVGVRVPRQAIQEGRVVLNIAPHAVDRLELGIDQIRFNARFSGVSQAIVIPTVAVLAVYAQENGQGMMFPSESEGEGGGGEATPGTAAVEPAVDAMVQGDPPAPERPRPSLRIVK